MAILGVDTSNHNHANGPINFVALKASGHVFVILKASEGVGFKDPYFDADRAAAHAAGLIVFAYHFGRGGSVAAEASWFLRCVGALQVGEGLVLDDEVPQINTAWAKAFCDAVYGPTTVKPLVYMNKSTLAAPGWAPVVADNDGLWLAVYDGSTSPPASGAWPGAAMKQYTSSGTVAGIAGQVDLDVFYGTVDQLAKYGLQGADMPLSNDDLRSIYQAVWFGTSGAQLIPNNHSGQGEWPYTTMGWLEDRIGKEILAPALAPIADAIGKLQQQAQTPQVDPTALAQALLADPKNVDALGAAIAAHLQLAPRADTPPA